MLQRECKFFDDWILSTESDEVKNVAKQYGFTEAYTRPKELSEPESCVWDAVKHALRTLKKYKTDLVVLLHATSPCLRPETVTLAVDAYTKQSLFDSMVSVHSVEPYSFSENQERYIDFDKFKFNKKRYCLNNAIHIAPWDWLASGKGFYSGNWSYYEIPADEAVDINNQTDFNIAESILHWRQHYESPESTTEDLRHKPQAVHERKRRRHSTVSADG
jgi:CMP-N-acetylneuraminic acid synthetase